MRMMDVLWPLHLSSAIKIHWTEWAFTSKCNEAQSFYEILYTALCSKVNYFNMTLNWQLNYDLTFNLVGSMHILPIFLTHKILFRCSIKTCSYSLSLPDIQNKCFRHFKMAFWWLYNITTYLNYWNVIHNETKFIKFSKRIQNVHNIIHINTKHF